MPDDLPDSSYDLKQLQRDAEYKKAWDAAPESFKQAALRRGISCLQDKPKMVMEFDDNFATSSYHVDMAETIDTQADRIIEELSGKKLTAEQIIRETVKRMEKPMKIEIEKNRALMIARIVGYLIKNKGGNLMAKLHGLIHAIPGMAVGCGLSSMRESARECDVSPQWLKFSRDEWCKRLGIPVPEAGKKSEEASEKYREAALTNHWRHAKFDATSEVPTNESTNKSLCKPTKVKLKVPRPATA